MNDEPTIMLVLGTAELVEVHCGEHQYICPLEHIAKVIAALLSVQAWLREEKTEAE